MGRSLEELDALPETELDIWRDFYDEQPFGMWRDDLRTGIIASTVANTVSSRTLVPADFMPFEERPDEDFGDLIDGSVDV